MIDTRTRPRIYGLQHPSCRIDRTTPVPVQAATTIQGPERRFRRSYAREFYIASGLHDSKFFWDSFSGLRQQCDVRITSRKRLTTDASDAYPISKCVRSPSYVLYAQYFCAIKNAREISSSSSIRSSLSDQEIEERIYVPYLFRHCVSERGRLLMKNETVSSSNFANDRRVY